MTETGRYIYCGRTDNMVKISSIRVSPFEVEQTFSAHPDVLEAAVVAAHNDMGLGNHVKEKTGKWKYPRWIEFVPDLPKTATGKTQRFKLRDGPQ